MLESILQQMETNRRSYRKVLRERIDAEDARNRELTAVYSQAVATHQYPKEYLDKTFAAMGAPPNGPEPVKPATEVAGGTSAGSVPGNAGDTAAPPVDGAKL